ncbi:MAG: cytochrome d ubiquinol oxidase subunit II [Micropruina sp.]
MPWSNLAYGIGLPGWILMVIAAAGLLLAWFMVRADRDGCWAFVGTTVTTAVIGIGIFLRMYPELGFTNDGAGPLLNIMTASATEMTLTIMTWAGRWSSCRSCWPTRAGRTAFHRSAEHQEHPGRGTPLQLPSPLLLVRPAPHTRRPCRPMPALPSTGGQR